MAIYGENYNRPLPLHEYVVRAVHHDLGDLGVPQEPLDRAEAHDLVRDLVHQPGQLSHREHHTVLAENAEGLLPNPKSSLRGRDLRQAAGIDPLAHPLGDQRLEPASSARGMPADGHADRPSSRIRRASAETRRAAGVAPPATTRPRARARR